MWSEFKTEGEFIFKMKCECYPGYEGDGFSCREINSCLKNNGNCPLNVSGCIPSYKLFKGSYVCSISRQILHVLLNAHSYLQARCIKKGPGINNCKCRVGYLRVGFERCLPSLSLVRFDTLSSLLIISWHGTDTMKHTILRINTMHVYTRHSTPS